MEREREREHVDGGSAFRGEERERGGGCSDTFGELLRAAAVKSGDSVSLDLKIQGAIQ